MQENKSKETMDSASIFSKVASYLRDYPFLLMALAGIVLLGSVFAFGFDKLKEFKWFFVGIVLVPVFMQFYFESKKQSHEQRLKEMKYQAEFSPSPGPADEKIQTSAGYSIKAIISMASIVLCFLAYMGTEEEELLADTDLLYGLLFFSGVALALAAIAWNDFRQQRVTGKKLIIADIVLSSVLVLGTLGWLSEAVAL